MIGSPRHSATDAHRAAEATNGTRLMTDERVRVIRRTDGPGAATRAGAATPWEWRREAVTASGFNLMAGGWLIVSPLALGYTSADAIGNAVLAGAVVLLLALARVRGSARLSWFGGLNAVVGLWLLCSAFWLTASQLAVWNTWCTGVVVLVMAIWSMSASRDERRSMEHLGRG